MPTKTHNELTLKAQKLIKRFGGISASLIQEHLKVGYDKAQSVLQALEEAGFVTMSKDGQVIYPVYARKVGCQVAICTRKRCTLVSHKIIK